MNDLLSGIQQHLATERFFKRGERIVVAVSGGVDSMVLLHALQAGAANHGWRLSLAHFNHRLRGRSSAADQRFVCAIARRLKLPVDVGSTDVRAAANRQGISIEMAARQLRHEFLARCARERGAGSVVLAHHADDQVELFLLRLMRGAGGEGLGGMKARNESPANRAITLVRPMLGLTKEQIRTFAREAKVRFREDGSNAELEFERNWVRHELLPLLRRRQPAVERNLLRTLQIIGTEAEFVGSLAESWGRRVAELDDLPWGLLPVAVQRRLMQRQIQALGVVHDFALVETLRTVPNRAVSVGAELLLVSDEEGRVRRANTSPVTFSAGAKVVHMSQPGARAKRVEFGGRLFAWRKLPMRRQAWAKRGAGQEFFDADKVGERLVLRHWRAGDRFQPVGMSRATKLQDWFTNRKVPVERRRQLVVAETERGEIFWVEGERIGEVCKVTPATHRLLELRWTQA